jgi:biopolymer transport protein ExbD
MPLSKPRRRRVVNMTPLIDVVFLLLVFFMLASTFLKFGTVKLETSGAGNAVSNVSKIALIHVGANREIRVAGQQVQPSDLGNTLVKQLADGRTDAVIVLRKNATTADLVAGLTRVRRHGFSSVRVVD